MRKKSDEIGERGDKGEKGEESGARCVARAAPRVMAAAELRMESVPGRHTRNPAALRKATRQPARRWVWPAHLDRNRRNLHASKAPLGYCRPGDVINVLPWAAGEDLVTTPQHNHTLASWQRTPKRQCAVVIDRHVHKNGGSTMRDIFLENERLGYGLYQGYMQTFWRSDWKLLQTIAKEAASAGRTPSHLLMYEAHFGSEEMSDKMMSDMQDLRQIYKSGGIDCPIVLVTRVREPLAYYLSFYKWGVAFRQREARVKNSKRRPPWGNNFTDWVAQNPNLQSSVMVRGMAAMPAEYHGRLPAHYQTTWERLDAMLSAFDVVRIMPARALAFTILSTGLNRIIVLRRHRARAASPCPQHPDQSPWPSMTFAGGHDRQI